MHKSSPQLPNIEGWGVIQFGYFLSTMAFLTPKLYLEEWSCGLGGDYKTVYDIAVMGAGLVAFDSSL